MTQKTKHLDWNAPLVARHPDGREVDVVATRGLGHYWKTTPSFDEGFSFNDEGTAPGTDWTIHNRPEGVTGGGPINDTPYWKPSIYSDYGNPLVGEAPFGAIRTPEPAYPEDMTPELAVEALEIIRIVSRGLPQTSTAKEFLAKLAPPVDPLPGPWEVETPMGDSSPWIVESGKQAFEWEPIATLGDCLENDLPPRSAAQRRIEANARLIAAAPCILAALEALLERYTQLVNCGDCGNWNPETEDDVIAARAAISKAKGDPA